MSDPIPIPNSLPIAEESAVEMFGQNPVKEKLAKNINSFFLLFALSLPFLAKHSFHLSSFFIIMHINSFSIPFIQSDPILKRTFWVVLLYDLKNNSIKI